MGKKSAQKRAEKRLKRAQTSKTKIDAQRQEMENKRIQIKSATTLIEGLYGDYVRLCGAVNNLKAFANMRVKTFTATVDANPTKYANLRVDMYRKFVEELKFIDELMEKLAGFLGACDDASSNHDKMLVVSRHIGIIYDAQLEFERRSKELQEMDKNFVMAMQKIDNPNIDITNDPEIVDNTPSDTLSDDEKEVLSPQIDDIKDKILPEVNDNVPGSNIINFDDVVKTQ